MGRVGGSVPGHVAARCSVTWDSDVPRLAVDHSLCTVWDMTDDRKGGIALIVGAIGGVVTMSLHPTGHQLFAPGRFAAVALLGASVHTLAIASMPISFLGALALSQRVSSSDRLGVSALVVYGFALAAGMMAAAVSGYVAPGLAHNLMAASPPEADGWKLLFDYNGRLNQACARILAVASSAAIMLWSVAILRQRPFARGIGIYGLVVGAATILAVMSGVLVLDVHGFGLVVFTQAIWFITVGVLMCRPLDSGAPTRYQPPDN